ncbi:MAG: molybdopterin-dependent oxidoreductase, partial [Chloroflexi bacterium]|nr:molybdopterin-dependent oxidoreductase [Chloroflexota bacterium]
ERGAASAIVADTDVPLGESTCIKCGTCVQVCPTGALIDRTSAYQGHDENMQEFKSVCVGCSVGCSVKLLVRNNRVVRIEGDWEGGVNHGLLCEHGRYHPMQESRVRITSPQMRKNGKLEPVSWDEALEALAEKIKPLAGKKNSVAALASTRLPVEALALFKALFVEKFKGGMVTSLEEGAPTAAVMRFAEKNGAFEGKLDVLKNADTVLCIGANLYRSHMVAGFLFKRNLPKGAHMLRIASDVDEMDYLANTALKIKPGSDLAVLKGLQAVIVKEGLGRSPLKLSDPEKLIEQALSASGVSLDDLTQAAQMLARSISPVIVYGKGVTAQRDEALIEELHRLAVLVGAVDGERFGLLSVKGEANSLAASLLGLDTAFSLNGEQAVYVALGDDYASKSLVERVSKAPYLVVQACYQSDLTEKADIVLPVTVWTEQEGHYINLDGRAQKAVKAVNPPENVRDHVTVLSEVAKRAGLKVKADWQKAVLERKSSVSLN